MNHAVGSLCNKNNIWQGLLLLERAAFRLPEAIAVGGRKVPCGGLVNLLLPKASASEVRFSVVSVQAVDSVHAKGFFYGDPITAVKVDLV